MKVRLLFSLVILVPVTLSAEPQLDDRVDAIRNWSSPLRLSRSQIHAQSRGASQKPQAKKEVAAQTEQRVLTPKLQIPGSVTPDFLVFVPITPCRLADTRPGSGYTALGSTPLKSLTPYTLPVRASCGLPPFNVSTDEAYSLNVTVVPPSNTPGGYLIAYPNPVTPLPLAASMTWNPGASYQTGSVVAAASPDGSINVVASLPTDVVIDINGYYAPPTDEGNNTGLGVSALGSVVVTLPGGFGSTDSGTGNTAVGVGALGSNTSAINNAAVGLCAACGVTTGSGNVAVGANAMGSNNGTNNVAVGFQSMWFVQGEGSENTALGAQALVSAVGSNNTAVGWGAGGYITSGNHDILIGNAGTASDDHVTRVGDVQTKVYVAGIQGITTGNAGAVPVVIDSNGQLGTVNSSVRFKEDIQDMAGASSGLLRLRPVTYRYKQAYTDGSKPGMPGRS
jgi:hypothetical protein